MADYMPDAEGDLVTWYADFATGVSTHGATVGMSAPEIAQVATDAENVALVVGGRSLYESKKQEFTAFKNIVLYGAVNTPLPAVPTAPVVADFAGGSLAAIVPRTRLMVERIKNHLGYTNAIGEDLRAVSTVAAQDPSPKPTLKAKNLGGYQVQLDFSMKRHDQMEIQSRRPGETEFSQIAFDTSAPYIDGRPPLVPGQPELREFRIRFFDDNLPTGEFSDVLSISVFE